MKLRIILIIIKETLLGIFSSVLGRAWSTVLFLFLILGLKNRLLHQKWQKNSLFKHNKKISLAHLCTELVACTAPLSQ
jgi:hypothetical protein